MTQQLGDSVTLDRWDQEQSDSPMPLNARLLR